MTVWTASCSIQSAPSSLGCEVTHIGCRTLLIIVRCDREIGWSGCRLQGLFSNLCSGRACLIEHCTHLSGRGSEHIAIENCPIKIVMSSLSVTEYLCSVYIFECFNVLVQTEGPRHCTARCGIEILICLLWTDFYWALANPIWRPFLALLGGE